jgi:acid phosphatase type 7
VFEPAVTTPSPRLGRRLLLAAAPVLVGAAAHAGPAGAAYPGHNGAVAFTSERHGEASVYVRRHGRTRRFLRGDSVADPAFSPRGVRIAVTRERADSGRAIWILNADGTGERQLTASELAGEQATWAPGARRLAYAAGLHGQRTIHLIGADGLHDTQLTTGPADQFDPAWSRRGTIAFVQAGPGGTDIYRVPARGGTPRRLTSKPGDDADPAWSPDGSRIAFVRGRGGIWVMSPWGRGARRVTHVRGGVEQGVAWSPDGRRLVFAGGPAGARRIYVVGLDGKGRRALSLPMSDGSDPDWQSVGHDPLIAAAGDIACNPRGRSFNGGLGRRRLCAMARTTNQLLRPDLSAVLALGDLQYPDGRLSYFYDSFGPSWGRLKPIIRPVPGNHEYRVPYGAGYYDYFNGPGVRRGRAGDRRRGGYYSFDLGRWHLVGLDSTCSAVPGGCDEGSPQQRWLKADLAAHRRHCTLAFWHHPLFSSLASEEGRGSRDTQALWKTLHDAGADLVLSGHQHFYERLAPQDSIGNLDMAHGLRSFVVGTGGASIDNADFRDRNSVAFTAQSFGILELTLHPRSYDWRFRSAGPEPFADSGHAICH